MALSFKHQAFLCLIFLTFSVFGSNDIEFKKKILISQAALNLCKKFEAAEGFLAGTLVKTEDGYRSIENLAVGDSVISFDFDGRPCQSKIVQISKKTIKGFVALQIGEKTVCAGPDQKFFMPEKGDWIKAKNIALSNLFLIKSDRISSALEIKFCDELIDVYSISLDEHHNFCITESDILVHNFAPAVGIGVKFAFDSAGVKFAGTFLSVGICGFFYKIFGWERKGHENKIFHSSDNRGSCCAGSGGIGPNKNDDDDPEKKKRNIDRAENMYEWFEKHSVGQRYRNKFERVSRSQNGEWRATETFKPHDDVTIKKDDIIYLDRGTAHRGDHLEWFNSAKKILGVLNLDLTINIKKTLIAIAQNRRI